MSWLAGGTIALGLGVGYAFFYNPDLISHFSVKSAETQLSLWLESRTYFVYPIFWIMAFLGSLVGMPSIFALGIFSVCWGPVIGWISLVMIHLSAFLSVFFFRGTATLSSTRIEGAVKELIESHKMTAREAVFWPRLFLNIPPRSLDALVVWLRKPDEKFNRILPGIILGISIRYCLQSVWIASGYNLLRDFRPFPEYDIAELFFCTACIFSMMIWTRLPEFVPGSETLSLMCRILHDEPLVAPLPPPPETSEEPVKDEEKTSEPGAEANPATPKTNGKTTSKPNSPAPANTRAEAGNAAGMPSPKPA
ncbi:MAG: hypothetical protein HQM09_20225 [Candidatus Riflebacteria bacterium]|nr:hypothetical protein [Candidatus Riflebacteria bacterium]